MNVKIRKDSWTVEQDNVLKEVVLKKIEQGLSQISGFEEASILLGRTKQACAFRWNKTLRPLLKREETSKKVIKREFADSSIVHNHLQQAIESYDEMKLSYDQISKEYNLLKQDYEHLINWVKQGITHIK